MQDIVLPNEHEEKGRQNNRWNNKRYAVMTGIAKSYRLKHTKQVSDSEYEPTDEQEAEGDLSQDEALLKYPTPPPRHQELHIRTVQVPTRRRTTFNGKLKWQQHACRKKGFKLIMSDHEQMHRTE